MARLRIVVALPFVLLACRSASDGPADSGVEAAPRSLVDHTRELVAKMPDARFRAELLAELAAVHAKTSSSARPLAEALLADAVARTTELTSPEDRDLATLRVATAEASIGAVDAAIAHANGVRAPDTRTDLMRDVAMIVARAGDRARALAIAEKIGAERQRGEALVAIGRAWADAGDTDAALATAKKCARPEHEAEIHAAIVRALVTRQRPKDAQKLADAIESGHWRSDAYTAIVVDHFRSGRKDRAEKLARAIDSSWIQARAYAELGAIAADAGRRAEADRLFEKAQEIADGIHDKTVMASALGDVATIGLAKGRVTQALVLAERTPSQDVKNQVHARVAGQLARERRFAEALELARKISGDPIATADAFGAIALAYSAAGNDERAMEALLEIPTMSLRIPPLARVISASEADHRSVTSLLVVHLTKALDIVAGP
ncbi:hypothetical protein L6R52_13630 [Myxococcota bacterium]|nr:hypothetical protein [Myxococcota bacterium]